MSDHQTIFDADNHYYEPRDAFTRYMDPRRREAAIHVERGDDGEEVLYIGAKRFTFLEHRGFDVTIKPGSLRDFLRNMADDDYKHSDVYEPIQPHSLSRDARLALMDEQRLDAILLFPTFGVCVEHFMKEDVEQTYANLHAFNRWLDDDWGFDYEGRIFAVPLMSLLDLDRAVDELDWALSRGARVVHLRPGPAFGRSPADPYFDPFWARLNEARVPVAFHIAESGYNEMMSVHYGEEANPASHRQTAFQWTNFYGDRPIMDTISSLIFHNLFGRFPELRVLSVENGSLFASYLMKVMDKMKGMGRNGPWLGGYVKGRPSEVFKRHVFISPYHEEDIVALSNEIGASQVLFGSDFPHAEGLAEPRGFEAELEGLSSNEIRSIMGGNCSRLVSGRA
ncbi:MAG: amidohydrolase family protein [Myxococcales bacterium]|nr:amidohydrolase family protein [Myxococcales bacterium]